MMDIQFQKKKKEKKQQQRVLVPLKQNDKMTEFSEKIFKCKSKIV